MFKSLKVTTAVLAGLCSYSYGRTPVVLLADTPVRVRTMQSISSAMQIGQYVPCQVADAVWIGDVIAIPRGAMVICEIAGIHKSLMGQVTEVKIKFIYARAASGERVVLRSGSQRLRADWKVRLVNGGIPIGTETDTFVSTDMEINAMVATEANRPGGMCAGLNCIGDRPISMRNRVGQSAAD